MTAGYSYQQQNFNDHSVTLGDFPNETDAGISFINAVEYSQDLLGAGFIGADSNGSPDEKIIAFFGRVNYTLDDVIFINASLRREGSTKLGADNQWGLFPSAGLGVDLNNYLNLGVDKFKVRLGYGITGALPGPNGVQYARFNPAADKLSTVAITDANPDLKWEEKAETNLGIEFNKGRFSSTLDLYTRTVSDFILQRTVDVAVYPTGSRVENGGDLSTKGFELALNYDVIKSADLNYSTGLILSSYNTLTMLR